MMSGTDICPVCMARRRTEHTAAGALVGQLNTPQGRVRFEQSQWLCLTHLQLLLPAVRDEMVAELLRVHARRLVELAESMREYVLKVDARRRFLLMDAEARAYRQSLVLLVGERYLVATVAEE
jgi:hypothetical protein